MFSSIASTAEERSSAGFILGAAKLIRLKGSEQSLVEVTNPWKVFWGGGAKKQTQDAIWVITKMLLSGEQGMLFSGKQKKT